MPVISNLVYTVTESTIVATWNTDVPADSNLFAGSKPAIDNGVAAASTSHQAVVTGLLPSTLYSCHVTSGGTSSAASNVTTNAQPTRRVAVSATNGSVSTVANSPQGDTYHNFVSNDNILYMMQDDGNGFVAGGSNAGYSTQIGKITNETTFAGTLVSLSNYGGKAVTNGTDGPGGAAMTNKNSGLFGINGNLHVFMYRQFPPTYTSNRYCNWIKSTDHGATWNNFTALNTFTANGNPVSPNSPTEPVQFYTNTIGIVSPVLYAADDGTLGYNTAGNQQDGANAYVYMTYYEDSRGGMLGLIRVPRIKFDAQTPTFEYWIGSVNPTVADFTDDTKWSTSPTNATSIIAQVGAWPQVVFVPTINSYLMSFHGSGPSSATRWHLYSAPTPAGPWVECFNQQNATLGQRWYGFHPVHRDLTTNVLSDSIPIRYVYNGEPTGSNYKPNWSTLTFATTPYTYAGCLAYETINQDASTPSVTSTSMTFAVPTLAGSCLVLMGYTGGGTVTVTDNAGSCGAPQNNTWSLLGSTGAFVCFNAYGTTSPITVTLHGTVSGFTVISGLYSITGGLNALDQFITQAKTGVSSFTTNALPVTQARSIALLNTSLSVAKETTTPLPWHDVAGRYNTGPFAGSAYQSLTASGNLTATETLSGSGNATYQLFNLYGIQYSISGNAGVAGATITYSGLTSLDSGSVTADASGNYSIPNLYNGPYTIMPSLTGYVFSPTGLAVTVTGANLTGVNFSLVLPSNGVDGPMIGALLPVLKARIRIAMAQRNK